jgi:hypothetical protein
LKVILCVLGLVASVTGAWAQVETYRLDWSNVGGGGQTFATGGPYRLGGSTGQADARVFSGGVYTLQGGFWQSRTAPVLDASSDDPVPLAFAARPPMPNPFRDQTTLRFDLPSSARVDLTLLSVDGRVVATSCRPSAAPAVTGDLGRSRRSEARRSAGNLFRSSARRDLRGDAFASFISIELIPSRSAFMRRMFLALLVALVVAAPSFAAPLGTGFTYQGSSSRPDGRTPEPATSCSGCGMPRAAARKSARTSRSLASRSMAACSPPT